MKLQDINCLNHAKFVNSELVNMALEDHTKYVTFKNISLPALVIKISAALFTTTIIHDKNDNLREEWTDVAVTLHDNTWSSAAQWKAYRFIV